jgi:hypothetical protein
MLLVVEHHSQKDNVFLGLINFFFVQGPKVMANDLELKIHKEIQMKLLKPIKQRRK